MNPVSPPPREITLDAINEHLLSRGIPHERHGKPVTGDGFVLASIRAIVPEKGVYYCTLDYASRLYGIRNSVVFAEAPDETLERDNLLYVVSSPQSIFYSVCQLKKRTHEPGVHPTAVISENATVDDGVSIGPYAVVGECRIGAGSVIHAHVVIRDNVSVGSGVEIQSHSCIGADGLAWIWNPEGQRVIQPQLGGVSIENDCLIGADVTIARGSLSEDTVIGKGSVISHGTKIGHGCRVDTLVHMANNVSLAGNARIGERAFLGSGCVVSSGVAVPAGAIVAAGAVVARSFESPFVTLAGVPARVTNTDNRRAESRGVPRQYNTDNG